METFVEINGYENKYYVSNYGNIKNSNGIVLKPYKINSGYYCIKLWLSNVSKSFLIHRLVAEYFIDNPNNNPNVDHIDSNRLNNHYSNLRWVTQLENIKNHKLTGNALVGFKHPMSSVSKGDVENILNLFNSGIKRKEIYKLYSCCRQTIDNVINKKYNYL